MKVEAGTSDGQKLVAVDVDAIAEPATGRRIRLLRERRKLTQAQLAKAAGVSQSDVSRAESEPGAVRFASLMKLADALGCTLFEFTGQKSIVLRAEDLAHLTARDVAAAAAIPGVELVH